MIVDWDAFDAGQYEHAFEFFHQEIKDSIPIILEEKIRDPKYVDVAITHNGFDVFVNDRRDAHEFAVKSGIDGIFAFGIN